MARRLPARSQPGSPAGRVGRDRSDTLTGLVRAAICRSNSEQPQTDSFVAAIRDRYPIHGAALQQLIFGPGGASASSAGARVFDAPRQRSVTIEPQRISFETSTYERFEDLRDAIADVFEVVEGLELELAPTRVGPRYIDEIDKHDLPHLEWARYIAPALSSPLEHFQPPPQEHQSAALFEGLPGRNIVFAVRTDAAASGESDRIAGDPGTPVRPLLETSITDELRHEVRSRPGVAADRGAARAQPRTGRGALPPPARAGSCQSIRGGY